jgi:hypothetical protein
MVDAVLKWWPVILCVLQGITMWVSWSLKKQFVSKEDLTSAIDHAMNSATKNDDEIELSVHELKTSHSNLQKQVDGDIDKRLLRIEEGIKHMPTHGDLTRLHKRMDDINSQLQQIAGSMNGHGHTLRLIEQHLLTDGKKP